MVLTMIENPKVIQTEAELIAHVLSLPQPSEAERYARMMEVMFPPPDQLWAVRVLPANPRPDLDL